MRREPPPEAVSPAQSGQTNPPRVLQPRPAELGKPTRDQALQGQKGKKSLLEWPMVLDRTHGFRDVLQKLGIADCRCANSTSTTSFTENTSLQ